MVCHGSYENGWGEHFRKSSYYVYRPARLDVCFLGSKKDVWHLKKNAQRMSPIPKRYWRKPISQRGLPSCATNIPSDSLCSAFRLTLSKCGIRDCQSSRYYIRFTYIDFWIWFSIQILHGSLNVPIEHHPTIRYMVYNGYYKVMSNSPKMGHLPIPVLDGRSHLNPPWVFHIRARTAKRRWSARRSPQ